MFRHCTHTHTYIQSPFIKQEQGVVPICACRRTRSPASKQQSPYVMQLPKEEKRKEVVATTVDENNNNSKLTARRRNTRWELPGRTAPRTTTTAA